MYLDTFDIWTPDLSIYNRFVQEYWKIEKHFDTRISFVYSSFEQYVSECILWIMEPFSYFEKFSGFCLKGSGLWIDNLLENDNGFYEYYLSIWKYTKYIIP